MMTMQEQLKKYLPPQFFQPNGVRASATLLLIALIMLVVEFYGWQMPYIERVQAGSVEVSQNELLFAAQVHTSLSFGLLFFLLPFLFHKFFPLSSADQTIGLSMPDWRQAFKDYSPLLMIMLPILFFCDHAAEFSSVLSAL